VITNETTTGAVPRRVTAITMRRATAADSSYPARDARNDVRWPDRERENRTLDSDPRDVFTGHLDLPRGPDRELVRDRDRGAGALDQWAEHESELGAAEAAAEGLKWTRHVLHATLHTCRNGRGG
jgi:hypothetical protein